MKEYKLLFLILSITLSFKSIAYERIVSINLCTDQLLYLLEEKEQFKCFNWTNLRPCEGKENISKAKEIISE